MAKRVLSKLLVATTMLFWGSVLHAIPVDLELILATDTSGSVDSTDFNLRRSGTAAAFRSDTVISAIEGGAIGSVAVTLWDFGTNVGVAVDWTQISNAAEANAFADAIENASRLGGGGDGQANMLRQAAVAIASNEFEATRSIVDIASEGVQSGEGCSYTSPDCQATRDARDAFLDAGGTAVNAIWLNDRNYFGLDDTDLVDAFEYGATSVIGGTDAFQVFAETNEDFVAAINDKLVREIRQPPTEVPEPAMIWLLALGLLGMSFALRVQR